MEQITYKIRNLNKDQLVQDFQKMFRPIFKISNNQNTTTIFILEEFYFRIESNLTITVIFDKIDDTSVEVNAISSGGKTGIMQLTWGAERKALKNLTQFFEKYM